MRGLIPHIGAQLFANRPWHHDPTPFHDHAFHEIAVVIDGGAVHQSIHGEETIARGDVVIIHPGQWHGYIHCATMELYNLGLAPAILAHELAWVRNDPLLASLLPVPGVEPGQHVRRLHLPEEDLAAVFAAFDRIIALGVSGDPLLARAESIGLATVILGRLSRHLPYRHFTTPADDQISALAPTLESDLTRNWALDELASQAGCSREHLCRRFRTIFGAAPLTWLARRRAERAAVLLLSSDAPVAEIGRRVGWGDPSLFARRFRALLGITPSSFRSRHQPGGLRPAY